MIWNDHFRKRYSGTRKGFYITVCVSVLLLSAYGCLVKNPNKITSTNLLKLGAVPNLIKLSKNSLNSSDKRTLKQRVQDALAGTQGSYGIYIKNFTTGESFVLNEDVEYDTASLYKLWVMTTAYDQIKSGIINRDDVISGDIVVLNNMFNIPAEDAELREGTITQTVSESLDKMITVSDNYSALLLFEKVSIPAVINFLTENGFTKSQIGSGEKSPSTTAKEMGLFFEKLHFGQLINANYSAQMLSLLKSQKINTKIPKYLPETLVIAHKTGELGEFTHDAGIIYSSNGAYVIIVLSKSSSPSAAEDRIARVSEAVYGYFSSK